MAVVLPDGEGGLVLDDPAAAGMIAAVEAHNRGIAKQNCQKTFEINADLVQHFKGRVAALGKSKEDVVIVLINVDDIHGRDLAEFLMPGANWQQVRDMGQVPYARGLADRMGIQKCLDALDKDAADKLIGCDGIGVVVIDHGTAEVFVAQGHIPTIEKMVAEGRSWDEIGNKIGWCPKTAKEHYDRYLKRQS
jgi:hypothetical protein